MLRYNICDVDLLYLLLRCVGVLDLICQDLSRLHDLAVDRCFHLAFFEDILMRLRVGYDVGLVGVLAFLYIGLVLDDCTGIIKHLNVEGNYELCACRDSCFRIVGECPCDGSIGFCSVRAYGSSYCTLRCAVNILCMLRYNISDVDLLDFILRCVGVLHLICQDLSRLYDLAVDRCFHIACFEHILYRLRVGYDVGLVLVLAFLHLSMVLNDSSLIVKHLDIESNYIFSASWDYRSILSTGSECPCDGSAGLCSVRACCSVYLTLCRVRDVFGVSRDIVCDCNLFDSVFFLEFIHICDLICQDLSRLYDLAVDRSFHIAFFEDILYRLRVVYRVSIVTIFTLSDMSGVFDYRLFILVYCYIEGCNKLCIVLETFFTLERPCDPSAGYCSLYTFFSVDRTCCRIANESSEVRNIIRDLYLLSFFT